ncbi:MAG TPA: hypothetical protein VHD32_19125 [Candidatus Didemnitutus sp.]|nr:hypothetical protein [Candidatus Didemnitutus sp.]
MNSPRHLLSGIGGLSLAMALWLVSGCQEPPTQVDGHDVTETKRVNGKTVHILKADDRDKQQTIEEAQEMKKSSDQVQFTPEEQAAHK